jgi:hypothetical protein
MVAAAQMKALIIPAPNFAALPTDAMAKVNRMRR